MPENIFGKMDSESVNQIVQTQHIGTLELTTFSSLGDAEKWIYHTKVNSYPRQFGQ